MNTTNPFTHASFGTKDPFQTAQSCLSSALASSKDPSKKPGESSFAAFADTTAESTGEVEIQQLKSDFYPNRSDSPADESASSDTNSQEGSEEEYFSLEAMAETDCGLHNDASPQADLSLAPSSLTDCLDCTRGEGDAKQPAERPLAISSAPDGFGRAIHEMNAMVEEVTRSFQRLKTITTAFNSRKESTQTVVRLPEAGGKSGERPEIRTGGSNNNFHFYYASPGEKQAGEDAPVKAVAQKSSQTTNSKADSGVFSTPSGAQRETGLGGAKDTTIDKPKDADVTTGKDIPSAFTGTGKPSPFPSPSPFEAKPPGSASTEKTSALPFTALATDTAKAPTDAEYPFHATLAGEWKCWRCTTALSTDAIGSKLKELSPQSTDLVGKAYVLIGCGSNQCLGAKRRFYFIPTGKAPILHKDVQPASQPAHSNTKTDQPFAPSATTGTAFGNALPNSTLTSGPTNGANASKQEANPFLTHSAPQAPPAVSSNPFLAAFAQQEQSSGSQPQFGVRSTISSSFNAQQQQDTTASSAGPVFGNSRFQNFGTHSAWGASPSNTPAWGQSNSNRAPTSQLNQNPNGPLNPFTQRPSAFSNMN